MINQIIIKNFKSLKKIDLGLKNLNLLMGLNGMGKSSLIQALLILKQSRDISRGTINLNEYCVQIGKGKDAMYQFNNLEEFIHLEIASDNLPQLKWDLRYNPDAQHLDTADIYDYETLNQYSLFNTNFQYLKAERAAPQDDYKTSSLEVIKDKQIGIDGYYAIHYLYEYGADEVLEGLRHPKAKSSQLNHQVDAWMGEVSPGIKLNTQELIGTEKILLDFQFETGTKYTNNFKPKNVGFGLTYVLPIIVSLLSIQKDKLLIIENPESHIHPKGQAELGKLIALAAANQSQIIVETHSDHILNGIRVAVKEKDISNNEVSIFYFKKITDNEEQFTEAIPVKIDGNGELSEYPPNMLDEWSNQLLKLL